MATILDSLVGSCVKKLQDTITEEAVMILGVKGDLEELQWKMNHIQFFLNDAAQRRTTEAAINSWLGDLRDSMYEADDIIDLARLEGSKLLPGHPSPSRNSAICSSFSLFSCIPNMQRRREIAVRIRNLNTSIEKILNLGKQLNLQPRQHEPDVSPMRKNETCSLEEPNLVGKETKLACTRLVGLMHANNGKKAYKIGIVGTGGIGKTTLAQKIYNDQQIKCLFSKQAWICVSRTYSKVAILKDILRHFEVEYKQDENFEEVSRRLAKAIENTSFLLVLDDVWEHDIWTNALRAPLSSAGAGTILFTTRMDTVARAVGIEYLHRVELMSEETGWELLWRSMNIKEEIEVHDLRDIGIEIVRMCGCLPLGIKVVASVLATKEKSENEWRKVLNKNVWSISDLPTELRGALYLSYDELPCYLRQCFLYCALYPEDSYMFRSDLVRYWIAEGFVDEKGGQLLEDTAEGYYYELIHRNLLQPDPLCVDYSRCKVRDLLRQLAQHLSGEEIFSGDPELFEAKPLSKVRRISIVEGKEFIVAPNAGKEPVRVRTMITRCNQLKVSNTIWKIFLHIRVLDLSDSIVQSIPDCIGRLVHLRLLDLDRTDISCLPDSIGDLMNLQVLNLQGCCSLHKLPSGITRLCNLRRLGLDDTPINQVPKGIGQLSNLNDLEGFPVGGCNDISTQMPGGWNLKELGPLLLLRNLDMINLEKADPISTNSLLIGKKHLKKLHLCYTLREQVIYSEDDKINVEKTLELLIPPRSLEDLKVIGFFGQSFPTWLGSSTRLPLVKYLNLRDCKSCVHLPPIGQLPNLKFLRVHGATAVTKIGPEFLRCGVGNPWSTEAVAFPKLESLVMEDMPNWEEWSFMEKEEIEATTTGIEEGDCGSTNLKKKEEALPLKIRLLPRLEWLEIVNCPNLKALPPQLGEQATSLKGLHLRFMNSLKVVENIPCLSDYLLIAGCHGLERVANLPKTTELRVQDCPNLRCVEKLDSLQQLLQMEDMQDVSTQWFLGFKSSVRSFM